MKTQRKNIINSLPDTTNICRALTKEYDTKLSDAIDSDQPIGIELLIEHPLLIANHLFESYCIDQDVRRYGYFFILFIIDLS